MEMHMADASVPGPPVAHPRLHFHKKFLDVFEDEENMCFNTLCTSIAQEADGDYILQMDIEGEEYRVLLDARDETLKRSRIMLVEFHHLDRMFAKFPFQMIRATFQKLLRFHHVVHIHPNNVCGPRVRGDIKIPPVMEFTFYRKDRAILEAERNLDRSTFCELGSDSLRMAGYQSAYAVSSQSDLFLIAMFLGAPATAA